MLADWSNMVTYNGTQWDDWDEGYKNTAYREGPIRKDLDDALVKSKKLYWADET